MRFDRGVFPKLLSILGSQRVGGAGVFPEPGREVGAGCRRLKGNTGSAPALGGVQVGCGPHTSGKGKADSGRDTPGAAEVSLSPRGGQLTSSNDLPPAAPRQRLQGRAPRLPAGP